MTRVDRITFVVPRRAWATFEIVSSRLAFSSNMFVEQTHRRDNLCIELIRLVVRYTNIVPELDILRSSKGAQACVRRLGYRKVGRSQRYEQCDLWRCAHKRNRFAKSRLSLKSVVSYTRRNGKTEVVYLADARNEDAV